MSDDRDQGSRSAAAFILRHRRYFIAAAVALVLYALAGFFLAPWLIERQAVRAVAEQFDSELRLGEVAVNPFVLSLRIDDLELDDPVGDPVARIAQIFVNFQTSSLFRWAWTFAEFRLDTPELYVSRDGEGRFNFEKLLAAQPPPEDVEEEKGPVRLIIHELAVADSALNWRDAVPPQPVETRFGPVDVRVQGLNTLPQRPGTQEVVIRTATEGTLRWSGSLQLNPLESAGQASVDGSHFELLSAYIRHETGVDITDGDADIDFTYTVSTAEDGSLSAIVDDLAVTLEGVRVQTYPEAVPGGTAVSREFLSLPRLAVTGGVLRWPEQSFSVAAVDIDDVVLELVREPDGMLDFLRTVQAAGSDSGRTGGRPATAGDGPASGADPDRAAGSWRLLLEVFRVNDLTARLRDESVQPVAETSVEALDLQVREISNEPGASFPTTLSLEAGLGGTVAAEGTLSVLPDPVLDFEVGMEEVALIGLQPYVEPLANVSFDSGDLNMQVRLTSSPENRVRVEGDLSVDEFLITETDQGTRLGSWDRLDIVKLVFSAADESLKISEARLQRPYADIVITEEGRVNLGRLAKDDGAEAPAEESGPEAEAGDEGELPIRVTVGRVAIDDGSAAFADRSLPLPFDVTISALGGELSTIDTASSEPSRVSAEGTVDQHGFLRLSGTITPLDPARDTDLRAEFENVAMPKFSAYSVPFAGRKIASGSLDLDLGYRLDEGRLVGDNSIVLREFELGEKVPHPDALSLPLGLAVALLKDSSGTIDVDLPVSGDVDSPEFSIGGIVVKALTNLITKIATAPFALLGNLLGVEASELEHVDFLPGRSDLTPPQMETATNLAEALTQRPRLVLTLPQVRAPDADAMALREARLEATIDERIEGTVPQGDAGIYEEQMREVLEELYRETAAAEEAQDALEELRAQHTEPAEDGGDGEGRFDALAYANALRERLIELQTLEEGALEALARERAANLREAIVAARADVEGRVVIGEPVSVEASEGGRVQMRVELSAGAGEELAAPEPGAENATGSAAGGGA